jgi:hypothetical protein
MWSQEKINKLLVAAQRQQEKNDQKIYEETKKLLQKEGKK